MPKQSVAKTTPPLSDDQLATLRTLMPQAFTEGRIDFEKLRASLGDFADDRPERYSFSWAGKRDAIRLLQAPSRATLVPCPEESLTADGIACHLEERSDEGSPRNKETLRAFGAQSDRQSQNLFIEGDNLEVLKLLYKPYFGRVKMIYIDPPYNTGNDFVYPDNFADPLDTYLKLTGQKNSEGNLLTSNPETGGRYHSAWLSMMYPRLFLARQLLREVGVIFVSIDDHEVHNLRLLMNEIFGEENFVATLVWQKRISPDNDERHITNTHDYVVCYSRSKETSPIKGFNRSETQDDRYLNPDNDPRGLWTSSDLTRREFRERDFYKIRLPSGREVEPARGRSWSIPKENFDALVADNRIWFGPDGNAMPRRKRFLSDVAARIVPVTWLTRELSADNQTGKKEVKDLFPEVNDVFENPKPTPLIKTISKIVTELDDIILDFFAGSCTSAQAVLELNREDGGNRRFIMVQLPEPTGNKQFPTIAEIGKERIRRVVARMKDLTPILSLKGRREPARQLGMPLETRSTPEDLGFKVFKLAPSNYRQWDGTQPDAAAYTRQAELFADPLVEGWQPDNVLYEVALKEGYGLNVQVEQTAVKGIQRVTDPDKGQSFYLTLAGKIALEDLRPLYLKKEDLFICRDSALDDDAAANLALQSRLKTI
jgi:adenine-specific DNA-methyltransferase